MATDLGSSFSLQIVGVAIMKAIRFKEFRLYTSFDRA